MKQSIRIAAALIAVLWCEASSGEPLRFTTDQSIYEVTPGDTTFVNIYLEEILDAGETSLLVDEGGLVSAQVTIERAAGAPLSPADLTDYMISSEFNPVVDPSDSLVPLSYENVFTLSHLDISLSRDFVFPDGTSVDSSDPFRPRVLLLTLEITAGTTAGDTVFNLFDYPDFGETFTYDELLEPDDLLEPLDPDIQPSSFTVRTTGAVAVPEPTLVVHSLALLISVAVPYGIRRRRLRGRHDSGRNTKYRA